MTGSHTKPAKRLDEDTRNAVGLFAYYVWNGTLCYLGGRRFELFMSFDYHDRLLAPELMRGLFTVYLANLRDGSSADFDPWSPIYRARNWLKAQIKPRYRLKPSASASELDSDQLLPPWKQSLLRLLGECDRRDTALWPGISESPLRHLSDQGGSRLQMVVAVYLNNVELGAGGEVLNHEAARKRVAKWLSPAAAGPALAEWELELP